MINDALLLALICALLIVLGFWQRKDDEFDLRWILVDTKTNKVSLFKLGQFLALIVSSWVLIYMTRSGKMTETIYGLYIATWSGVNVLNKLAEKADFTKKVP